MNCKSFSVNSFGLLIQAIMSPVNNDVLFNFFNSFYANEIVPSF